VSVTWSSRHIPKLSYGPAQSSSKLCASNIYSHIFPAPTNFTTKLHGGTAAVYAIATKHHGGTAAVYVIATTAYRSIRRLQIYISIKFWGLCTPLFAPLGRFPITNTLPTSSYTSLFFPNFSTLFLTSFIRVEPHGLTAGSKVQCGTDRLRLLRLLSRG
jgi:hypothetical protein